MYNLLHVSIRERAQRKRFQSRGRKEKKEAKTETERGAAGIFYLDRIKALLVTDVWTDGWESGSDEIPPAWRWEVDGLLQTSDQSPTLGSFEVQQCGWQTPPPPPHTHTFNFVKHIQDHFYLFTFYLCKIKWIWSRWNQTCPGSLPGSAPPSMLYIYVPLSVHGLMLQIHPTSFTRRWSQRLLICFSRL